MLGILSILGWIRMSEPVEEWQAIPFVTGRNHTELIQNSEVAVILYGSEYGEDIFSFANYAIGKYKTINFARSTSKDAEEMEIHYAPCSRAYVKGKLLEKELVQQPFAFAAYCEDLVKANDPIRYLLTPEALREVIESMDSVLIGIDQCEVPANRKKGEILYCTDSQIFKFLGINVTTGLHVYRGRDRSLLPVKPSNYRGYMKSHIADVLTADLSSRPYFAGYVIDEGSTFAEEELAILTKLSAKSELREYFHIGPLYGTAAMIFENAANTGFLQRPLFLVVVTQEDAKAGRWVVNTPDHVHDIDYLTRYLIGIANESIPYKHISSPIDEANPLSINYDTYWSVINASEVPAVVIFWSNTIKNATEWSAIFREANTLMNGQVRFYVYDAGINDLPQGISLNGLPVIGLYRYGKQPVAYPDRIGFDELIEWISLECEIPVPPYDSKAMKMKICDSLNVAERKAIDRDEL